VTSPLYAALAGGFQFSVTEGVCVSTTAVSFWTGDHVAYRNSTTGSLYIQKFIEVMYKRAHDTHLEDILKQVSRDLSQTDPQMPSYTVQLRKDLYLPVDPR